MLSILALNPHPHPLTLILTLTPHSNSYSHSNSAGTTRHGMTSRVKASSALVTCACRAHCRQSGSGCLTWGRSAESAAPSHAIGAARGVSQERSCAAACLTPRSPSAQPSFHQKSICAHRKSSSSSSASSMVKTHLAKHSSPQLNLKSHPNPEPKPLPKPLPSP